MEQKIIIEMLIKKIREYANGRRNDVARGAETPRLAALLLQKYGIGMIDAVSTIYESPRVADDIFKVLDLETAKIDPNWIEHNKERWKAKPADITNKS
ncbi:MULTISPECIES: hypothetical protein [Bacillus cereus group]|uniref:Uncharacterized protein n=1 Tax=Bacillus cereus (strain G9842) TaxID=405531 RepID=B7IZ78_BACC2|nr:MULTISPECIES: hypothetical protein [Bacillus cereus group]ACK98573.1 conserved hypothetical protein [Bacillus cereus G9842]MDR4138970.1 hypothetical protein [Bacillus cereus]MDR4369324.1 hypothetical protein [Bacillus cereus]PEE63259.1 hypothetical protein COM74_19300 [Bacillus thuringiensis]